MTKAMPSSTAAMQEAYTESLAERAETIASVATESEGEDGSQSSRSAETDFGNSTAIDLTSSEYLHRFQENNQGKRNQSSNQIGPKDIARNVAVDNMPNFDQNPNTTSPTTVMICNIPCRVTLQEITQAISFLGFDGTYDLLHAPGPKRSTRFLTSKTNIGYAFINFLNTELAQNFVQAFDGFCFEARQSAKVGTAKLARIQGFHLNYEIVKNRATQCVLPMGAPSDLLEM